MTFGKTTLQQNDTHIITLDKMTYLIGPYIIITQQNDTHQNNITAE
jgi:hypothetical protein